MLELIEQYGEARVEGGLEEQGREVEVARGSEVRQIEIGDGHLRHDAGVGEDVTLGAVGEQDGYACGCAGFVGDMRSVEAGFGEPGGGDVTHFVGADLGGEADAGAEEGEIMGQDGGGPAEGEVETGAEQLAIGGHGCRQAIENEVEVGLAGDGDVERFGRQAGIGEVHRKTSYCFVA